MIRRSHLFKKLYGVFFIAFSLLFVSCADLNKKKQLSEIKTLNNYLDSIHQIITEKRLDSISQMSRKSGDVELRIKNYLISDTINLELGKKMDAYKIMRKKCPSLNKDISELKALIKEEKVALKELKHDIDNASGRKDKYDEYISFEKNKVKKIKLLFNEFSKNKTYVFNTYKNLHEELYTFSISLIKDS